MPLILFLLPMIEVCVLRFRWPNPSKAFRAADAARVAQLDYG